MTVGDPATSDHSTRAVWGHRPALDGLRTVAVYLVVLFHAAIPWLPGGFVGVDVFFVLSGYLVTNVLLNEWSNHGRIDLRRFYARRIRRLLPAAIVVIVVTAALSTLVVSRLTRQALVGDAQASLLYVANWNFLRDATDYFAEGSEQSPFLHFWSLAIEEQFYFVFPALLIVLLRFARRRPEALQIGITVLLVASLAAQILIADEDPLRAYYGTDTRIYQMLAGSLLAIFETSRRTRSVISSSSLGDSSFDRTDRRWADIVTLLALIALFATASDLVTWSPSLRGIVATVLALSLIVQVQAAPESSIASVLSSRPMTYLGRISYGTYLWHWPAIVLLAPVYDAGPYELAGVVVVMSTGLSALSHRFLEMPVRKAKPLDRRPRRVVAGGLAVSALAAVLVIPPTLHDGRRPVEAAREDRGIPATRPVTGLVAEALAQPVPAVLDLDATDPIDVDLSACTTGDPQGCVLAEGAGTSVHLIGDSNAEMAIHAMLELAVEHDWSLSVTATLGCPWQDGLVWVVDDQRRVDRCVEKRDGWYEQIIPALDPDVIVTISVPRDAAGRSDGLVYLAPDEPDLEGPALDAAVAAATAHSVATITSTTSASVIAIEPLPFALDFDPTNCLTTAEIASECSYEAPTLPLPVESTYRALASSDPRFFVADLDRIACPFLPVCVPLINGRIVFRNKLHLSDAWMVERRGDLLEVLEATGAFVDR
ncbi:MAG: acyltransferase [Ilumatobacter sp.]|uniref:acyltransferase family protein n=1 Tax=Ilumatobacter sp. TaxID=1967498 RepID=UPI003C775306